MQDSTTGIRCVHDQIGHVCQPAEVIPLPPGQGPRNAVCLTGQGLERGPAGRSQTPSIVEECHDVLGDVRVEQNEVDTLHLRRPQQREVNGEMVGPQALDPGHVAWMSVINHFGRCERLYPPRQRGGAQSVLAPPYGDESRSHAWNGACVSVTRRHIGVPVSFLPSATPSP